MGAGRKRKAAPWDKAKGWKPVKVGDDLMIGSTESGFMGLDILEPEETLLFGNYKHQAEKITDEGHVEGVEVDLAEVLELNEQSETAHTRKKAKVSDLPASKTREKAAAKAQNPGTDSTRLALLTAKIAALEAENSALKAKDSVECVKPAKKQKAPKTAKVVTAAPVDDVSMTDDTESVDISAWSEFDLHPKIGKAIAQAGFTKPTPIQQQCLLPAVRDRRDVIGAAQTVSMHAFMVTQTLDGMHPTGVTRTSANQQCIPSPVSSCMSSSETMMMHQNICSVKAVPCMQGSGKTLAFGLPILQRIMLNREESTSEAPAQLRALILAPTRELALQVCHSHQAFVSLPAVYTQGLFKCFEPM